MTAKDLQEMILKLPKGSFQKMIWSRELKLYKKFENQDIKITKVSEGTVRFGVEYDNMKAVQEKRENGELPQDNQGLNGMEWIFYPYLLKGKNGKEFVEREFPSEEQMGQKFEQIILNEIAEDGGKK